MGVRLFSSAGIAADCGTLGVLMEHAGHPEPGTPTRREMAVHRAKVRAHQLLRGVSDRLDPMRPRAGERSARLVGAPIVAESRSPLWRREDPREWILQAGKVENLRVASASFHGAELAAGQVFSFWAHLGRPSRSRGFVAGRELREGCVVPSIAGGICQLSNALYAAALDAGLTILERHAHSRVLPGSAAEVSRDATVLWNYVDLRFVAPFAMRIEVELSRDQLIVRFRGRSPKATDRPIALHLAAVSNAPSCLSCDKSDCARSVPAAERSGERAFVVDGVWPEFDAFVRSEAQPTDRLMVPMDGARWGRARYAWCSGAFGRRKIQTFEMQMIRRAVVSRRLAEQGAERQHALLQLDAQLARAMGSALTQSVTRLVVTQSLLPHLWAAGYLGGRQFDVLANRLPLASLQARLDEAARRHPQSKTAADFRAPPWLVAAESEALDAADRVITPHSAIADCATQSEHVPWILPTRATTPAATPGRPRPTVLFAAATIARKGCYELRSALQGLDVELMAGGSQLEGPDFWRGVHRRAECSARPDLVVLPAWVEHAPRRVLRAVASGVPAIVSTACGLRGVAGIREVAPGDVEALHEAIAGALARGADAESRRA